MHLVTIAFLLLLQVSPQAPRVVEPAAAQALEAMVKAYRSAGNFRQESVYSAPEGKNPPILRSRLVISRPNRIVLDMVQPGVDRPQPYRLLYQSDGKDMYAYQETKGFYAKEKAPKNLKELDYLAVNVEMAAITGGDPVAPLVRQSRAVRIAEAQMVDGVMSDGVVFQMGDPGHTVELKLFIGQKDHFLRKFDYSSTPIPKPEPEKPKDRIIVGDPNEPPPPEEKPEEPVRLTYENHVFEERGLPKDVFKWVPPAGSFQYQDYPGVLNPRGGTPGAGSASGKDLPGQKPMKIVTFEEMMKKAWKEQRKRRP